MADNTISILTPSVNNLSVRIFVRAAGLDFEEDVSGWIYLQSTRALFLAARGERDRSVAALKAAEQLASPDIDADVRAYLLGAKAEAALAAITAALGG